MAKAIKGTDATNFARDREFQKLSKDQKADLVNSRKTMLVIREPLQSQDLKGFIFNYVCTVMFHNSQTHNRQTHPEPVNIM